MTDESIFAAALAIPSPAKRAAYFDRACAGDPALRHEIEDGLQLTSSTTRSTGRPPTSAAPAPTSRKPATRRPPLPATAAERQALALMDHPNIARVLDAGSTPAGRPFIVMEPVRGVPITE